MKFSHIVSLLYIVGMHTITIAQSTDCSSLPENLPVNQGCVIQEITNNDDGTTQIINASCAAGYGNAYEDAWFSVIGTGNPITVTLNNSNRNAVLAAFTGCGTGEITCQTVNNGTSGNITFSSVFGVSYYIQIQRRSGSTSSNMDGDICATSDPVEGNIPCQAALLNPNGICSNTTVTTVGSTLQTNISNGGTPSCATLGPDIWMTFEAPPSGSINISTIAGTITDAAFSVYSGTCTSLFELTCVDDVGANLMPSTMLTDLVPYADYFIRIWDETGGTGNLDICLVDPSPINLLCSAPFPICIGTPLTFDGLVDNSDALNLNPNNNYNCLADAPGPSWWYLDIDIGGDLEFEISATADVDFAIWGPFTDIADGIVNCDSYGIPEDCSYSIDAIENVSISGVLAGETYILLISNFEEIIQTISVNELPSNTAETFCAILLSVELSEFSGFLLDREIHLNWTTASETNSSHFIVEKSTDLTIWSAIDALPAVGNSSSAIKYKSIDKNPSSSMNYYRLKEFDKDGSVEYSDVIAVSMNSSPTIELFPNPTSEHITISSPIAFSTIGITNLQGMNVFEKDYSSVENANIDVSSLKSGVYFVSITTAIGTKLLKRLMIE